MPERSVSCSGGAARWTREDAPSALLSLYGLLFLCPSNCSATLCLQCEDCKLRRSAREPGGSGFLGYRHLPTAWAPAAQKLLPRLGAHGTAVNWHILLHLIYIMWLTIATTTPPPHLLSLSHMERGIRYYSHVLFFFLNEDVLYLFPPSLITGFCVLLSEERMQETTRGSRLQSRCFSSFLLTC